MRRRLFVAAVRRQQNHGSRRNPERRHHPQRSFLPFGCLADDTAPATRQLFFYRRNRHFCDGTAAPPQRLPPRHPTNVGFIPRAAAASPSSSLDYAGEMSRSAYFIRRFKSSIASCSSSSTTTTTTNENPPPPPRTSTTSATSTTSTTSTSSSMEQRDVYRHLGLSEFTDREIDALYDAIVVMGTSPKTTTTPTTSTVKEEGALMTSSLPSLLITETNLQAYLFTRQQQQAQEQDSSTTALSSSAFSTSESDAPYSSSTLLARQILERLDLLPPPPPPLSPTDATTTTTTTTTPMEGTTAVNKVVDVVGIDKETFRLRLQQLASTVDYWQIWPIAVSMGITGVAVGVVNPAMPLVIEQLSLDSDAYGTIVAAFGLAKLLLNIPAAVVTERYGRKPFLTYGSMPLLAVGVGGIGIADSVTELFVLRLLTGTGVALLSTAATLMLTDASTPRNRASSIAPVMSAFSLGMVVGPGLGGYSMEMFGLRHTFAMVGASYLCVGLVNHFLLAETKAPTTKNVPVLLPPGQQRGGAANNASTSSSSSTLWAVVTDWRDVLTSQPAVRNVIAMNGMYWTTLAGAQMTILPLLLTTSAGYSAVDVGHVYMGMSALQIVGNPVFAAVSDRIGRLPVLLSGTTLMGGSLFYFDNAIHPEYLLPALAVWSCGSSMLSTAPVAYVSDHVPAERRAAAIALLRTSGDVGLLVGSLGTGYLAHATTIPTAMSALAGLIWTSTAWVGTSTALRKWSNKTKTD